MFCLLCPNALMRGLLKMHLLWVWVQHNRVYWVCICSWWGGITCALTFPGIWVDGSLTLRLLPFIKNNIVHYKICIGKVFPRSGSTYKVLAGPMNEGKVRILYPLMQSIHWISLHPSEWGMRGLQGSFPWWKNHHHSDSRTRTLFLELVVLIHNFVLN